MDDKKEILKFVSKGIIELIMRDTGVDIVDAFHILYGSKTYSLLKDVSTGLYLESTPYVYSILKGELITGKIIQCEY